MQTLKDTIIQSSALISINYSTDRTVYLSVDSSICSVGWILSQDCPDGRRRPSRFSSISWNERESCYSQAKLELYGLFHVLWAQRLYLIGIRNLIVEVDASYIKGMLRNPDIQPNAAINCWIAAILLFDFKLIHVPADKHRGPDGLSRRKPAPGKDEEDDPEDWVDQVLSLSVWVVSWLDACSANSSCAAALTLAFEADNNEDTDSIPTCRPRCNHRLPARYHMDEYIANNSAPPPSSFDTTSQITITTPSQVTTTTPSLTTTTTTPPPTMPKITTSSIPPTTTPTTTAAAFFLQTLKIPTTLTTTLTPPTMTATTPRQSSSQPATKQTRQIKKSSKSAAFSSPGVPPLIYLATRSPVSLAEPDISS